MTFLEFVDNALRRRHERAMSRPHRERDVKTFVGLLFLAGYYAMVWQFSKRALPTENLDLIRDAMLTLGPPVGAIVAALFRTDVRDAQTTANTGEAFRAMSKLADQGPGGSDPRAIKDGDTIELNKPQETET